MGNHRIEKIVPLFFISAICLFGCNAFANPIFGLGTNILNNGSVAFELSSILYNVEGRVDYEVYGPQGGYTGVLETVPDGHHVYAYQVYNNLASELSIDNFIVSLIFGGEADDVAFVSGGGVDPWATSPSGSGSAAYLFTLGIDTNSSILWFSSEHGPTEGKATITGYYSGIEVYDPGATFDENKQIFVPTPEPVSFVLFGGVLFMLRSKRRSLKRS